MNQVRPTKRSLDQLEISFPHITTPLHSLEHPVIQKSQKVPEAASIKRAERILGITDKVLYKVKVQNQRGAVGHYDLENIKEHPWWLVGAGERKEDSKNQDFYSVLVTECTRQARGGKKNIDSSFLAPQHIDRKRLHAEQATLAAENTKLIVREAICRSAQTGKVWKRNLPECSIAAYVKSQDGETYLSVITDGFVAPKVIAVILSSVPGVSADDWMHDSVDLPEFTPRHDQLVYSSMLPAPVLAQLLEEHNRTHI